MDQPRRKRRWILFGGSAALILVAAVVLVSFVLPAQAGSRTITGVVRDASGPVSGALVKVQTTEIRTYTDEFGAFRLENVSLPGKLTVVAWSQGYTFGWADVSGRTDHVEIVLSGHSTEDHPEYDFQSAETCRECHPGYVEWRNDAHAQSALNPRFLTMYNGTDVEGNRSRNSNYDQGLPRTIDPSQEPYYGPGFKVDFPQRDGDCAACHAPMAAKFATSNTCAWSGCHMYSTMERSDELQGSVNPNAASSGVAAEGINCDFCHKVAAVDVEEETGLPDPDYAGIMRLTLYRPGPDDKLFMGSVEDVAAEGDTFNPLYRESAYCAACHYQVVNEGTLIYNSFGEWLASPYSDPETGRTCQDCHMPVAPPHKGRFEGVYNAIDWLEENAGGELPGPLSVLAARSDRNFFVLPEKGGQYRDPEEVHLHDMPGVSDEIFMRNAVAMDLTSRSHNGELVVQARVMNKGAGHHIPTGSPLRQMFLVIEATDASGAPLTLKQGGALPEWAVDLAGAPGKAFAKVLRDELTGEEPTYAHWRTVVIAEDTRIPARATDISSYTFAAPENGPVTVRARLVFRRSPLDLQQWKGWDDPDMILAEKELVIE